MEKKIWLDMDNTISALYNVPNWLEMLVNSDPTPYVIAEPMLNMSLLARYLNKLASQGWELGVISWLSKNSTPEYDALVKEVKLAWLAKHLKSVNFTTIYIVPYGTHKFNTCGGGILFDDEDKNRNEWEDEAYEPSQIINILKGLVS